MPVYIVNPAILLSVHPTLKSALKSFRLASSVRRINLDPVDDKRRSMWEWIATYPLGYILGPLASRPRPTTCLPGHYQACHYDMYIGKYCATRKLGFSGSLGAPAAPTTVITRAWLLENSLVVFDQFPGNGT